MHALELLALLGEALLGPAEVAAALGARTARRAPRARFTFCSSFSARRRQRVACWDRGGDFSARSRSRPSGLLELLLDLRRRPCRTPRAKRALEALDVVLRDGGVGERHPLRGDDRLLGRGGGVGGRSLGAGGGLTEPGEPDAARLAELLPQLVVGVATGRAGALPGRHQAVELGLELLGRQAADAAGLVDQALLGDLDLVAAALPGGGQLAPEREHAVAGAAELLPQRLVLGAGTTGGLPLGHQPVEAVAELARDRPARAGPRTRRSAPSSSSAASADRRERSAWCALRRSKNVSRAVENRAHRASSTSRPASRRRASASSSSR